MTPDNKQKPQKSLIKRFFEALDRGNEELDAAMFRQLRGPAPCQCKCDCKTPKP